MTDRDHFAAAALAGLLGSCGHHGSDHAPKRAYELADAMLRESGRCPARMEFPAPSDAGRDSPGEGWRWVEPHEPLESGDQFLSLVGRGWLPAKCYGDGRPSAYHRFFRRRIDAKTNHDAAPAARAEIERLREAIRRLADQDATLSVCGGNVTVTMDATLTDAEREAIKTAIEWLTTLSSRRREIHSADLLLQDARTLRGLLDRLK